MSEETKKKRGPPKAPVKREKNQPIPKNSCFLQGRKMCIRDSHSILAPAPQNQGARGLPFEIAIAAGGCYNRKTTHGQRRTVKISLA